MLDMRGQCSGRSPRVRTLPIQSDAMNRIDSIFRDLRNSQRRALMPFICGQHPRPGTTGPILQSLDAAGASIVEVGFPFSDPIADGPVIAAAMHAALLAGSTPTSLLEEISAARSSLRLGVVAMVSVSILHRLARERGPGGVARWLSTAGVDGVILPDLPLEESEPWRAAMAEAGLTATLLISPTTPPERAARIAAACSGFVYVLARSGITGERAELPDVDSRVRTLRGMTDLPIAVGFGISTPAHVRHVVASADAAIVGSALVRRIGEAEAQGQVAERAAGDFCRELANGLT